jgi:hypothetical protein
MAKFFVQTSQDKNAKGMDNSFYDGDNQVTGSPFSVGTSATSIQLDGTQPGEVMVYIEGNSGKMCYLTIAKSRDAAVATDIPFPAGSIISVPNSGQRMSAIGDDPSIKLRVFYSFKGDI